VSEADIAGFDEWNGGLESSLVDLRGIGLDELLATDDPELAGFLQMILDRIDNPGTRYGGTRRDD
jgi:hypothetical protein